MLQRVCCATFNSWPQGEAKMISVSKRYAIASTLFWVMGALLLLLTLAIEIPLFARNPTDALFGSAVMGVMIVGYFVSAVALRRNKQRIRWWAVALCVIAILFFMAVPVLVSFVAIPMNAVALLLIALPQPAETQGI
jgi:predicted ABC-type exoprotein transport system permease subunit